MGIRRPQLQPHSGFGASQSTSTAAQPSPARPVSCPATRGFAPPRCANLFN
jgi:hypothetical protein